MPKGARSARTRGASPALHLARDGKRDGRTRRPPNNKGGGALAGPSWSLEPASSNGLSVRARESGHPVLAFALFDSGSPLSRGRTERKARAALSRRQHHHHLPAFEARLLLDLGELDGVGLHPVEQFVAEFLVGHLAAAEAQGDLDLV